MLRIIVCIKQVPDTDRVRIDKKNGTLVRESISTIINPDDLHALEMALYLKEHYGAEITALTMGPVHAEDVLREAYACGVDKAVLVSDEKFAGSDALATSKILSRAIKHLGDYDVIITGVEAIDGNTSIVPFQISEFAHEPPLLIYPNSQIQTPGV